MSVNEVIEKIKNIIGVYNWDLLVSYYWTYSESVWGGGGIQLSRATLWASPHL